MMTLEMMQAIENEMRDNVRSSVEELCNDMHMWDERGLLSLDALLMDMTWFFVKNSIDLADQGEVHLLYFDKERCKAAMQDEEAYDDLYEEIMEFVGYNDTLGLALYDMKRYGDSYSYEKIFIEDLIECLKADNTFVWMGGCQGVDYIHSPLQEVW